jgi:hypothetical protein
MPLNEFAMLSEAEGLLLAADSRSFASLRMTIHDRRFMIGVGGVLCHQRDVDVEWAIVSGQRG